jgi:hypothetical protein
VAETLEELEIPYMIGGSQAAVYYGEPRLTRDVDIVAALESAHLAAMLDRFPAPEFYVSEEAASEALESRGQFNIIHPASGLKIDIFVNRDTPYDRLRLERRRRLPLVPGRAAWFARAEDVILYKLIYYREGQSDLHLRDVIGILRVSRDELDSSYVAEWVERLGLGALWDAVLKRAAQE